MMLLGNCLLSAFQLSPASGWAILIAQRTNCSCLAYGLRQAKAA